VEEMVAWAQSLGEGHRSLAGKEGGGHDLEVVVVQGRIGPQRFEGTGVGFDRDHLGSEVRRPHRIDAGVGPDVDEERSRSEEPAPGHHVAIVGWVADDGHGGAGKGAVGPDPRAIAQGAADALVEEVRPQMERGQPGQGLRVVVHVRRVLLGPPHLIAEPAEPARSVVARGVQRAASHALCHVASIRAGSPAVSPLPRRNF